MNTYKLTKTERLAVIRFCLHRGTRIKCSTMCLHRPLDMADLETAFLEREAIGASDISKYKQIAIDFAAGKGLPDHVVEYWFPSGKPTQKEVDEYVDMMIKQQECENIRKYFQVAVDLEFLIDKLLAFHKSLNPRPTFAYSSSIREECDAELTDERREIFLEAIKHRRDIMDSQTYGGMEIKDGDYTLRYEDMVVYRGDRAILETITHEQMLDVGFDDSDLEALKVFEGKHDRNAKIIAKLQEMDDNS